MILGLISAPLGTRMNQSQLLLDISTHALLHLEFKKLDKRLTQNEINNLLVQYLKRYVKANRYQAVKKSTKKWLLVGRQSNKLESFLIQEQERLSQTVSTDLFRFVELIGEVETQLRTKVQYSQAHKIDLDARYGKVLVCVVDENLTSSFDDQGLMTKATQILFIGNADDKDRFSAIIDKNEVFQSVIAYEDENHLRIELFRM